MSAAVQVLAAVIQAREKAEVRYRVAGALRCGGTITDAESSADPAQRSLLICRSPLNRPGMLRIPSAHRPLRVVNDRIHNGRLDDGKECLELVILRTEGVRTHDSCVK